MTNWIVENPAMAWIIFGLFLAFCEANMTGVFIIFFAMGACATGIACLFFNIPFGLDVISFLTISLVCLFTFRNYFKRLFNKKRKGMEDIEDEFIGKKGIVEKSISPIKRGKISFKGSSWDAESQEYINVGDRVIIVSRESIVLQVKKLEESN